MEREVYNTSSAKAAKLAEKKKKKVLRSIILRIVYKYPLLNHHDPLLILRHYKSGKKH
jgi:hypothetical protein